MGLRNGILFGCSFGVTFWYGVHLSQTYNLPDLVRSVSAVTNMVSGNVVSKKRRKDDEEDD